MHTSSLLGVLEHDPVSLEFPNQCGNSEQERKAPMVTHVVLVRHDCELLVEMRVLECRGVEVCCRLGCGSFDVLLAAAAHDFA